MTPTIVASSQARIDVASRNNAATSVKDSQIAEIHTGTLKDVIASPPYERLLIGNDYRFVPATGAGWVASYTA
jgi:hypothetical protein